jgi:hypothetical protein
MPPKVKRKCPGFIRDLMRKYGEVQNGEDLLERRICKLCTELFSVTCESSNRMAKRWPDQKRQLETLSMQILRWSFFSRKVEF